MKRTILAGLLLCLAIPLSAADKWYRVETANYTLVGNASQNQIKEVGEGLEVFRTVFSRFFKLKEGSSIATKVVVFRSDQAFKPYKPLYKDKPINIAGLFQPGRDVNFILLTAEMQTPRVIFHELVHRFMSDNLGSLPPWFQEGFAECFSTLEIEGKDKKVRIGRAIAEHVELLNQRLFMPLDRLFAVRHGSPEYNEESKQGLFYAESWALVHYMMFNSEERRAQFNQFLNEVGSGRPAAEAFETVFNTDLQSFQRVFEAYIQQRMAWNAFELKTPDGLNRSKDMKASSISEGEAEAYLGDLLVRQDRFAEAETHLKRAVELEPKLGITQAAMGQWFLEQDRESEARAYMQRAAELDSGNYLMHYYYARALENSKDSTADRQLFRRELQKTIELAPAFVEATEMLASQNLSLNADIPQTVEMLVKAVAVAPGRDYLAVELAAALSRTQEPDLARPLARNLLAKPGLDPQLRVNLENVLAYLDRVAANSRPAPPVLTRADADTRVRADLPREIREEFREAEELAPPELARGTTGAATPEPVIVKRNSAVAADTLQVRGILTLLDCTDGLTASLVFNGGTAKFHSSKPSTVKFTSFNPVVSGTVACGPAPGGGIGAEITYRPVVSSGSAGELLAIEFMDPAIQVGPRETVLVPPPGTSLLTGRMTLLECSNGVTVTVAVDGQSLQFHNDQSASVSVLNGPNPDGTADCGPMPGDGVAVTVIFRPSKSDAPGTLLTLRFDPKRN